MTDQIVGRQPIWKSALIIGVSCAVVLACITALIAVCWRWAQMAIDALGTVPTFLLAIFTGVAAFVVIAVLADATEWEEPQPREFVTDDGRDVVTLGIADTRK